MSDAARNDAWKSKAKRYFWIALALALIIWAIVAGSRGQRIARSVQESIQTPEFEYAFVAGGPQRFPDAYNEVDNADTEAEISENQFLWSTIVMTNVSEGEATDFRMVLDTVDQPVHVLVAPAGYGTELEVGTTEEEGLPQIELSSFDSTDTTYVFLAFSPEEFAAPYDSEAEQQWARTFDLQLEELTIDTEESNTQNHYGKGYAAYLNG